MRITASRLKGLLAIIYLLVIDYRDNGEKKASSELATQLNAKSGEIKEWSAYLPSLPAAIKSAISGKSKLNKLIQLGFEIKDEFAKFKKELKFSSPELDTLKALGSYLRTDSEPAYKKLVKNAGLTNDPWVNMRMKPKKINQSELEPRIRELVKEMTGRNDVALTVDEGKTAKKLYSEQWKEYAKLRTAFSKSWKNAATSFVRDSGKHLVPYKDVVDYLESNGIVHTLPHGFTGLVDDQLRPYTTKRKQIEGLPSGTLFPTIIMNTKYPQTQYIFQAVKADGKTKKEFYLNEFREQRSAKKFELVDQLNSKMPKARKSWQLMVDNFNISSPESVASVILSLLYLFSARVGTPGNNTFGIGTLEARHFERTPTGYIIRYKGKDSIKYKHVLNQSDIKHKKIIEALDQLMAQIPEGETKGRKARVFVANKKFVGPAGANKLFKKLTGMPNVTVHKIRTYRGTALFKELVDKEIEKLQIKRQEGKLSDKDVLNLFKKFGEKVGKLLGHIRNGVKGKTVTGLTAIKNYIDTKAMLAFFEALSMRPPKVLESKSL